MTAISGLEEALREINDEVAKYEHAAQEGIIEAMLKVLNSAQRRLQPSVITGNLRASGYYRFPGGEQRLKSNKLDEEKNEEIPADNHGDVWGELGFTAVYALNVHENEGSRSPKFLESAIRENKDKILEIIRRRSESR